MNNLFINGSWVAGLGDLFTSTSPVSDRILWQGAGANETQVNLAVSTARAAFKQWSNTPFDERLVIIEKFAALMKDSSDELALVIAQESGKALWESKQEVAAMIGKVAISVQSYKERTGEKQQQLGGVSAYTRHRPHGVVAVYGPYNFPGHLPNGHIVPALLAGNVVLFKPSEQTPLVAEKIVEFWVEAGIPHGVISLLQGEAETGKLLASHTDIDGLFFTGSSTTGKAIHSAYAGQPGKILALELGGNNPLIVSDCADKEATVYNIIQSAFITSGQRCTCARRLFVKRGQEGDELLSLLTKKTAALTVADPLSEQQPFMGTMISQKVAQQLLVAQQELVNSGAMVLKEMALLEDDGAYLSPGILDVTECNGVKDEELFGPLLQVYRYDELDQAIEEANNTSFGLSAGLLSDSEQEYQYFYNNIRAGIVNWNRPTTGAASSAPFGGVGDSGNHRPSAYYAADYCSYPVASMESESISLPDTLSPGMNF